MGCGPHGAPGVRVLSHVVTDKSHVRDLATLQPQPTVDNSVKEAVLKPPPAQVQLVYHLRCGLCGPRGLRVLSHVVTDNTHERELA